MCNILKGNQTRQDPMNEEIAKAHLRQEYPEWDFSMNTNLADIRFALATRQLIEIGVGDGHLTRAQELRDEAALTTR